MDKYGFVIFPVLLSTVPAGAGKVSTPVGRMQREKSIGRYGSTCHVLASMRGGNHF